MGTRLGFRGVGFHVGMGLGFVDDGVELGVDVVNVITKSFCVVGNMWELMLTVEMLE